MNKIKINWVTWLEGMAFVLCAILLFQIVTNIEQLFDGVRNFLGILFPFFLGLAIAYFLSAPCNFLERQFQKIKTIPFLAKRARGFSVLSLYIMIIFIISLIISYIVPIVTQNIVEFINVIPTFYQEIYDWLHTIDLSQVNAPIDLEELLQTFLDSFYIQDLLSHLTIGLNSTVEFALTMTTGIFDIFVAIVLSIYTLLYKKNILRMLNRVAKVIMKKRSLEVLKYYLDQTNTVFYKFIATQFIDACIMGFLAFVLLAVLNIRFAVTLAIFLGFCNMIPKFGSIFGSIVVMILTFFTGGFRQGLILIILLTIVQNIDGNIIGPMLMGNTLKINPILVFVALLIGGAYFGIIGFFLAVPIAVMIKIVFDEFLEAREKKVDEEEDFDSEISERS